MTNRRLKICICTYDQFRSKQGIHLSAPDLWYTRDGIETALKDNYPVVYLHYEVVGTSNYVINSDVLNFLIQVSAEYRVEFTHAAETHRTDAKEGDKS